jgi:hypothetical protein
MAGVETGIGTVYRLTNIAGRQAWNIGVRRTVVPRRHRLALNGENDNGWQTSDARNRPYWNLVGERPAYPAAFVSDGHVLLTLWQVTNHDKLVTFDRKTNVGLHHLALRVGSEEALDDIFSRVSGWPGVVPEFAPENLGEGPKRHAMVYEPGGIRLEFDFDPRI